MKRYRAEHNHVTITHQLRNALSAATRLMKDTLRCLPYRNRVISEKKRGKKMKKNEIFLLPLL